MKIFRNGRVIPSQIGDIDKCLSEMITAAALEHTMSIGTFVFDSPLGEKIVKITVEPTDKEIED